MELRVLPLPKACRLDEGAGTGRSTQLRNPQRRSTNCALSPLRRPTQHARETAEPTMRGPAKGSAAPSKVDQKALGFTDGYISPSVKPS